MSDEDEIMGALLSSMISNVSKKYTGGKRNSNITPKKKKRSKSKKTHRK